jgi:hypothetical protein
MGRTDDDYVLVALLRGCHPVYYNYGWRYWTASLPDGRTAYGYTHNECCRIWACMFDQSTAEKDSA